MAKKSIMIDLDDPRTDKIADVISNKTSKKILSLLAEQELSETELSKNLNIPINTIEYNINKLEQVGLIEKTKGFYWSQKGKKIYKYVISNKKIIISPKSIIKGIIPSLLITSIIALGIKFFVGIESPQTMQKAITKDIPAIASEGAGAIASEGTKIVAEEASRIAEPQISQLPNLISSTNAWAWFLLGALTAMLIFLIWNSIKMKGGK